MALLLLFAGFISFSLTGASITSFLTSDELRYTFGVRNHHEVPKYEEIFPDATYSADGHLNSLSVTVNNEILNLQFEPSLNSMITPSMTTIYRDAGGGGRLEVGSKLNDCHYQHKSKHAFAAVSNCDGHLKGTIVSPSGIHVIHPLPEKYVYRFKRDVLLESPRNSSGTHRRQHGVHVLYKREAVNGEFCGLESTITATELDENENAVNEDVFVTGQRLAQESDLIVELAIFVDELLWKHFSSEYGDAAYTKLQDYAMTMLNNIQIMYHQPTAVPPLTFHVVRFEVLKKQPSAMYAQLHDNGNAQQYLDRFCRYQRNLSRRDWDHAFLLTGYDIHRGTGSRSISGIARLDGMCDPWNTCTLAEGLDFTSAFIGTHELGHSVGMRHDEPYCPSKHIMSSSLGPGKVTWSTCSLRDYHVFLQKLDSRGKNCLRYSNLPETLTVRTDIKPGQLYDADTQCQMMHGHGYKQVKPRQDHYDGICYMMWCGKSTFGRIITSHPALEGTFCGHNKWCELGRCVAWPGDSGAESAATAPKRVDGGWSEWSRPSCSSCSCSSLFGSIGVTLSTRSCSNPTPANGGAECIGSSVRALVCNRKCPSAWKSVDRYIADKCDERKREKNDKELTGTGSQLKRYPQRACKIFCDVESKYGSQRNYRFFGDNLPDGTLCGRNRYCLDGECLPMSCDDTALINRDQSCPQERCPLTIPTKKYAGEWGSWSLWSFCSQTCGGGFRERTRSCRRGRCDGTTKESEACEVQSCPSQTAGGSSWSEWTPWNQCSVTCGKGSQARYRRCTTSENSIARDCPGSTMDIRPCDKGTCETGQVGLWGTWTEWSTCSTTCGPGIQTRNRYCTKEPCDGSGQARMSCNLGPCSEGASEWQEWSAWSQCSRLCGKGLRTRKRKCHGNNCVGSAAEQQICNETPCTGSTGQWSNWSSWGSCSVTCGAGVKRRTRHCQYGNCPGSYKESAICGLQSCGDATWGGWGYWSTCSETCGRGVRKRVRKCYGTGHCSGSEYERESCYNRPC